MAQVQYKGTSDARVIRTSDIKDNGHEHKTVTWDTDNGFVVELPDDVAEWLTGIDKEFKVVTEEKAEDAREKVAKEEEEALTNAELTKNSGSGAPGATSGTGTAGNGSSTAGSPTTSGGGTVGNGSSTAGA